MALAVEENTNRKAGVGFVLWIALGTALAATLISSLAMAVGPAFRNARQALRSLGLSPADAGRAAARAGHDFHVQMLWTAAFAAVLLVGWLLTTRSIRSRRSLYSPKSGRGRFGLGVVIGFLAYGFVALPLAVVGDMIVTAGRGSF